MKRLLPLLSLVLFSLNPFASPVSAQSKIVGGSNSTEGDHRWMVSINTKGSDPYQGQFCGGSLIHPSWVLTAAHCMEGETASGIEVYVGAWDLDDVTAPVQRRDVRAIYVHSGYREDADGDLYNDIALLLLANPSSHTPIQYASGPNAAPAGTTVTALGWGDTESNPRFPSILQEVDLTTVTISRLRRDLGENSLDSRHLGAAASGRDTCQGDSGGPLFIPGATPILVGVTSFGLGCADGTAGVYANVGNYKNFLDSFLSQPTTGDPDVSVIGRGIVIPDGSRATNRATGTFFGSPVRRTRTKTFFVRNTAASIPMTTRATIRRRHFSIARNPGFVFQNSASALRVRFRSPGVRRTVRGTVTVRTNDPANPLYTFRVRAKAR